MTLSVQPSGLLALLLCASCLLGCQSGLGKPGGGLFGKSNKPAALRKEIDDSLDPMGPRNGNRLILQDLAPSQIGTTLKAKTTMKVDREGAQQAYDEGQRLYRQAASIPDEQDPERIKLFEQAANSFRLASARWRDSAIEQDALFYEGESYFFANRYVQANRSFEKLVSLYSGSRYLDKAESRRFAIAQYWLSLARSEDLKWGTKYFKPGDPQRPTYGLASEARRILHRIRLDDPTGKFAGDATMALANAYFESQMYEDAADTYEDLRMNFPASKHQFHAHLFELKARMNSYYGDSYDAEPLIKANELLTRINTLYRDQAVAEQAFLDQEHTRVRNMLANRDYVLGEYYEQRGENRAAQIMYAKVSEDYHDTQLASHAEQRIGTVKDKPPIPEQQAQWLVDLFPQSEAAKPMIATGNKESIFR